MFKSLKTNSILISVIIFGIFGYFDFANAKVIENIGTNKSCSTVCLENNTKACVNVGNEATASNKYYNIYINGKFSQQKTGATCSDIMSSTKTSPFTTVSLGTNCQCTPNIPTPILQPLAINGNLELTLFWGLPTGSDSSGVTNYEIYRGTSSGMETFLKEVGKIGSYIDYGLTNNTKYYYKIAAKTIDGIGEKSNEVSATAVTYCTGTTPCTSWGSCVNEIQTCNTGGYSLIPTGCTLGTVSAPTQSCLPACTSYVYSDWSACLDSAQTRTVLSSVPSSCSGGVAPVLSQSCTLACTSADVSSCSSWSSCVDGIQTCTGTYTKIPAGCTGGTVPVPTQSCAVAQPAFTYGVYAENTTGILSGYAWSDNIGWIKFGGLSSFPVGAGTIPQNAQLISNKLVGWARACAGTVNGNCSTMESRTDGWDGWISLGGTSVDGIYSYSVLLNGTDFSGFAWGSDVVGWIDFTGVKLTAAPITNITISLSAASSTISKDTSTTISWSSTGADTCTIAKNGAAFASGTSSQGISSGNLSANTYFVAQCDNEGNTATKSISVNVIAPEPKGRGEENDCDKLPESCEFIWEDSCKLIENDSLEGMYYTLSCTNPDKPEEPPTVIEMPQAKMSDCTPTQGTSAEMYVNRVTKWTMKNRGGDSFGNVKWDGTNMTGATITPTGTLDKIYTTIGKKTVTAVTKAKHSDGTSYISSCSTSTIIKLDTGVGGEI